MRLLKVNNSIAGLACISVVAFACWLVNERSWQAAEQNVRRLIYKNGGKIRSAEVGIVYFPIEAIDLSGSEISDNDIDQLAKLRHPYTLDLSNTSVSDKSTNALMKLTTLTRLNIQGTNISPRAAKELKRTLPQCTVLH